MRTLLFTFLILTAGLVSGQSLDFLVPPATTGLQTWEKSQAITVPTGETWLKVTVTKQPEMQADYDDLRFVLNPSGTEEQKRFLPYWIESYDGSSAVVHVGFRSAPSVSSTFYMLYGNNDAVKYSNIKSLASTSGWFGTEFDSPGLWYDIHRALNGYDILISGNPSGEENHPAAATDPITGKLLLWYKVDDANIHPGSTTSRIVHREGTVNSDETITWGATETIFDPAGANGAMNVVAAAVNMNGVSRKIALCNYQVDGGGGDQSEIRIWYSIKDDAGSWSTPANLSSLVGLDRVTFGGTQGLTTHDKIMFFACHSDNAPWAPTIFYTRDYGVTWGYVEVPQPSGTIQLNETAMVQLKDASGNWIKKIRCTSRNEHDASSNPFYDFDITWDNSGVYVNSPTRGRFADVTKNRPFYLRTELAKGDRVFCFYGTTRTKAVYSDDEGETFKPVPYFINDGNVYGANRTYNVGWDLGNGRVPTAWVSNILAGGSDLYLQYFDANLMQFRTVANTTLTDSRPRPIRLNPGVQIGTLVAGYKTTSSTNNTIPTTHPTSVTFTVGTGLSWAPGDAGVARRNSSSYFQFTVDSYSGSTLTVSSTSNTGTGTGTTWDIDKTSNLLNDQAYVSHFEINGKGKPVRVKAIMNASDAVSSIIGFKQLEKRAVSTITVTNAGSAGDVITLKWEYTSTGYLGLHPTLGKVASYTVQSGDNIAAVVNGLAASFRAIGICDVVSSDATTITVEAPRGQSSFINTLSLTVSATGTVSATAGAFSGGAVEAASTFNNDIVFNNTTVGIEQNNDGFNLSLAPGLNLTHTYEILWDNDEVTMTANGITRTKIPTDGSGIPDWDGALMLFVSNTLSNPQALLKGYKVFAYPGVSIDCTLGSISSGTWYSTVNGKGIQ